ncbi:MAG TPA: radical SAM protein [Candidatus Atribacteria bacterium]|nr:radical SAM protein [Candidatus Atribacteria bacterium]
MKKNFNLLLINPWIYDFTAYDFWSKPLGLLYVASILREQGYEISYIDCMDRYNQEVLKLQNREFPKKDEFGRGSFYKELIKRPAILKDISRRYSRYGITEEIFLNKLKKLTPPQAVLITSIMTYWYPGVFRVIEKIKKVFPGIPIILGGVYATLCFEHASKFSGADYIVKGNNIRDWLKILEQLSGNINDYSKYEKELDKLPYPAWDLYSDLDYISILSSRGCPYRCSYCASFKINPKLEFRNPEEVVKEIEYWNKRRGIKDFVFYDDALLINLKDNFLVILEELINKKLGIRIHTPNGIHARMINKEIACKMYQAGVETIRLGFETVDPRVQSDTGGKITNIEFKKAVNCLLEAGFKRSQIGAYLLIGIPGQDVQEIIDSIHFVIDCGAHPRLAKFSAIPGTKVWNEARIYFNLKEDVDPLFHNDALLPYLSPNITDKVYQQIKSIAKI